MSALADQPAFPGGFFSDDCLTVRQHFAFGLMQAMISASPSDQRGVVTIMERHKMASYALDYADALIAALEEKK